MDGTLNGLLRSRKFLIALVALAQTLIFNFVPDFPKEVWISIDGVLVALIASIAAEDAAEKHAATHFHYGTSVGVGGEPVDDENVELPY